MPQIIGDPDNLITAITHLAESESHKKVQEAKQKAESIQEEGEHSAQEAKDRILEEAGRQAAAVQKRSRSQKTREANLAFLQARDEALQSVWKKAEGKLRDLTEQEEAYTEALKTLVLMADRILEAESLMLYPESHGRSLLTEKRLKSWGDEASKQLNKTVTIHLADKDADIWGGIIIKVEETNRRIDASFETRLQIARDEIQNIIFKQLAKS